MIYDKLDNIEIYKGISEDIYEGLTFLRQVSPDTANGVYQLNPRVKAIVSEYETKTGNENGFEAHKRFLDIQCTLKGIEKVCCLPIEKLKETMPYKEENDAALYAADGQSQEMIIGGGYFAIFFPQDGHMPQLCVNEPMPVKKVVVKVQYSPAG
ncbi:MAG: YhcH/YjgK/YiaL family protein [Bacteroidaceae bacterium]|nr:YhcH/YjgK/YiaL family protein [Bacteroidaceae bacterium]